MHSLQSDKTMLYKLLKFMWAKLVTATNGAYTEHLD